MLNNIDNWVVDIMYPKKQFTIELIYFIEEKKWFINNLFHQNVSKNKYIFDASNINTKNIDKLWYHWETKDALYWENKWVRSRTDMNEGEFYELSIKLFNKLAVYLKNPNKPTIKIFKICD
jgi:hypothetical protein